MNAVTKIIFNFAPSKQLSDMRSLHHSSVFCVIILWVKYKRIEWGSSNVPKVSAQLDLTARNALSLLMSN